MSEQTVRDLLVDAVLQADGGPSADQPDGVWDAENVADDLMATPAWGTLVKALAPQPTRLVKALERLLRNAEHIYVKKPVRDWAETLAEARAALAASPDPEGSSDPE